MRKREPIYLAISRVCACMIQGSLGKRLEPPAACPLARLGPEEQQEGRTPLGLVWRRLAVSRLSPPDFALLLFLLKIA
ncbi:hypothetical protein BDW59DRAFT_149514 [Aspergillus cavernicola]|uniref:Uncharacterized protein n=1 Tax=Aspergillus cavernicola TaxID=176166 RepID=A0ABR4I3L3_9EURO